jgi:fido (protein-threonine AMPylation protein)
MPNEKPNSPDLTSEEYQEKWEFLQSLRLKPEAKSLELYDRILSQGIEAARSYLKDQPVNAPTLEMMKDVHKIVYSRLFEWAGEVRQPGLGFVVSSEANLNPYVPAARWTEVKERLEKVCQKYSADVQKEGVVAKAEAMAEFHHEFETIHPFVLGNGIVGRLVLDEQAAREFNLKTPLQLDRPKYEAELANMDKGAARGQLRDHILGAAGQTPSLERADQDIAAGIREANQRLEERHGELNEQERARQQQMEQRLDQLSMTPDPTTVKQKAVADRVFLDTIVLGGAGEALTKTYQVTIPQSVAHAISSQNAPNEVREWLTQSLQKPATDVTIEEPKNTVPDNDRLLRGSRDAMQLTRENPGSVLLSGARWGMGEAAKENLPVQDPAGFIEQADRSGVLNAETVAEKLAARQEYRLVGLAAEIQAVAEQIQEERTFDVAKELESLRDEVEEQQTLSDFENVLKQSPENIHGLNRNELLATFQTSEDQAKTMRETEAKLRVAAGVERGTKAIEPLLEQLQGNQTQSQTMEGQSQDIKKSR